MSLLALALLAAQTAAAPIAPADLERHIAVLAGDAMAGRKPGTPGGDAAAYYIARAFREAGLVGGAQGGGWYMPVALFERRPIAASLGWRGGSVPPADMAIVAATPRVAIGDARLLFVGHGIVGDPIGVDNLAGLDLTGAVVLMLPGKPKGMESAPSTSERREALFRRGAAAVLLAMRAGDDWGTVRAGIVAGETGAADAFVPPIGGALAYPAWGAIAGLDPQGQEALVAAAGDKGFRGRAIDGRVSIAVTTAIRRYDSWNVIGRLPGTDRQAGALLYLAHWDHLGVCAAGKPDPICNGAVDNASGVAMLIEIARGIAVGRRLPRDIFFAATTAEEMGLIGAKALAKVPPVPLAQIAAVLNFDTVAVTPKGFALGTLGRGMTRLDPLVDATARELGRAVSDSRAANDLISRQDGWAFTAAGVPAIMVTGSLGDMAPLEAFFASSYHRPDDDLSRPLMLDGEAEDADFHVALARRLADPKQLPPAR